MNLGSLSENPNMSTSKNPRPVNTDKEISVSDLIAETLREVEEHKARYWREREADVFAQIAIERIRQRAMNTRLT